MAVLLDVLGGQKQLLVGHQLLRLLRGLRRLRKLRDTLVLRLVLCQKLSVRVYQGLYILGLFRSHCDVLVKDIHWRQRHALPVDLRALPADHDLRLFVSLRGIYDQVQMICRRLQIESRVDGRVFDCPHLLVGHEVLLEGLLLKGLQPGEIRLVLGKHPCHQLDVRAVLVRQVPIPGLSEIAAAPGPLLLSRRDMVVRHVEQSRLLLVIIAAHKIVIGMLRHVGGWHRNVLVA